MSSQADKWTGKESGGNPLRIANGQANLSDLAVCGSQKFMQNADGTWQPRAYLHPAAARAFDAMHYAAASEGVTLIFSGGYRTFDIQVALRKSWCDRGLCSYAAPPGTSNHGYAMAVDMVLSGTYAGIQVRGNPKAWMDTNARRFGFAWPIWADNPGVYEPWHWQAFTDIASFVQWALPGDDPMDDGILRIGEKDRVPTIDANPFMLTMAKGPIAKHQYALRVWLWTTGWPNYPGAKPFVIDGDFGPRTQEVVAVFQAKQFITPQDPSLVGVIGGTTRSRLTQVTGIPLP